MSKSSPGSCAQAAHRPRRSARVHLSAVASPRRAWVSSHRVGCRALDQPTQHGEPKSSIRSASRLGRATRALVLARAGSREATLEELRSGPAGPACGRPAKLAVVGRELDLAAHHDRLLRAGLLAQTRRTCSARGRCRTPPDSARCPSSFELTGNDGDAVRGAGELAQTTGHAAGLSVVELHQHGHAAEGVGIVDPLFGILHHEVGAVLPSDEAAQIPEEVTARHLETLDDHRDVEPLEPADLVVAFDLNDAARHARHYRKSTARSQRIRPARRSAW